MIDTHSHIYADEFDVDRAETVRRAIESGVTDFVLPAVDSGQHEKLFEVAALYPNHHPTIGVHPTSVKEDYERELEIVKKYLESRDVVAVGEVGLDYYWDKTFIKEQEIALRQQLEWAMERNLPVILHTREAYGDMLKILRDYSNTSLRTVFHSFSGTAQEADTILSYGDHLLGIGGVVTFKKSNLGDIVRQVGLESVVLETDAPYLAPVPYRGKRNESSYIPFIVAHLSTLLDLAPEEIDRITTNNAKHFFKI